MHQTIKASRSEKNGANSSTVPFEFRTHLNVRFIKKKKKAAPICVGIGKARVHDPTVKCERTKHLKRIENRERRPLMHVKSILEAERRTSRLQIGDDTICLFMWERNGNGMGWRGQKRQQREYRWAPTHVGMEGRRTRRSW